MTKAISEWVGFGLAIVVLVCVAAGVIAFFAHAEGPITAQDLMNFLSITVSSISLLVGMYFAILAVNAYSHVKEIDLVRKKVLGSEAAIAQSMIKTEVGFAELMFDLLSDQIFLLGTGDGMDMPDQERAWLESRRNELYRKRCLLGLENAALEMSKRQRSILELAEYGKCEDIPSLMRIINDRREDQQLRNLTREVVKKLQDASSMNHHCL